MTDPHESINAVKVFLENDPWGKPKFKSTIGLTKREHIAIEAMHAYITATNVKSETLWSKIKALLGISHKKVINDTNITAVCRQAVKTADFLINELNKQDNEI